MATYSTITICNRALVLCGASPITALTDDTANARALNAIYDMDRKSHLTENRWTFSLTRSTLATNSTTNLVPWFHDYEGETIVYDRPSDCLRIWEMDDPYARWREEGQYIISDTNGLGAKWTFDHNTPSQWLPKFVDAFIDKLCSSISFMILNDAKKAEAFLAKYEKVSLPAAKSENSQTGTHQVIIDDEWTSSKYYNGSGGNPARSYS